MDLRALGQYKHGMWGPKISNELIQSNVYLAKKMKCLLLALPLTPNQWRKTESGKKEQWTDRKKKTMVKQKKLIFYASNSSE